MSLVELMFQISNPEFDLKCHPERSFPDGFPEVWNTKNMYRIMSEVLDLLRLCQPTSFSLP